MTKITTHIIGDLKGILYYTDKMGYTYKIKYKKELVGQSYVYLRDKYLAYTKMMNEMKCISGFNNNLFDLEKLV